MQKIIYTFDHNGLFKIFSALYWSELRKFSYVVFHLNKHY